MTQLQKLLIFDNSKNQTAENLKEIINILTKEDQGQRNFSEQKSKLLRRLIYTHQANVID